jgi:ketopantoate reductase
VACEFVNRSQGEKKVSSWGKLIVEAKKRVREKLKSLRFFIHVYFSDEIFKRIWDKLVGNFKFKFFFAVRPFAAANTYMVTFWGMKKEICVKY